MPPILRAEDMDAFREKEDSIALGIREGIENLISGEYDSLIDMVVVEIAEKFQKHVREHGLGRIYVDSDNKGRRVEVEGIEIKYEMPGRHSLKYEWTTDSTKELGDIISPWLKRGSDDYAKHKQDEQLICGILLSKLATYTNEDMTKLSVCIKESGEHNSSMYDYIQILYVHNPTPQ